VEVKFTLKKPPTNSIDTRSQYQKDLEVDRVQCVEALSSIIDRANSGELPKSVGSQAFLHRTKVQNVIQSEEELAKDVKKALDFIGKYMEQLTTTTYTTHTQHNHNSTTTQQQPNRSSS
jgi:hypothetical protein